MIVYVIEQPMTSQKFIAESPQEIADYLENADVNDVFTISVEEMTIADYQNLPEFEEL